MNELSPSSGEARWSECPDAEAGYRFLSRLCETLGAGSLDRALSEAAAAVNETIGDWCAIWLFDRLSGESRLAAARHREEAKTPAVRNLAEGWLIGRLNGSWRQVMESPRPVVLAIENQAQAREIMGSRERARLASRVGLGSLVAAPLVWSGRRLGLLVIVAKDPQAFADGRGPAFVGEMAPRLATVLARLLQTEQTRDISQQLTFSSLRLQTILQNIPQAVIVAEAPEGHISSFNSALSAMLGRRVGLNTPVEQYWELFGMTNSEGEPYRVEDIPWVRAARTGEAVMAEEVLLHPGDGRNFAALCSASALKDEEGRVAGAVAVLQDISDRKEFERQKDDFLAIVAHELKTPLTSVKGYVQLMQRRASRQAPGQPLAVDQSILQTMNRQVDNLARMISGLLDFSAIQMGRLELQRRWFSMGELARESMEQMQVMAPSRHLHVVVDGETSVEADADRVHEVLLNLISNAIKATEPGGEIQVSVVREGQEIVVSVRDNGVGMPKDVQEHIFERLYRGGDHHQQRMGLCLFVTKGIVDAHGGRIWFESEPGKGTTFHFSLPAGSQPGR